MAANWQDDIFKCIFMNDKFCISIIEVCECDV